jgi:hypothetical protein
MPLLREVDFGVFVPLWSPEIVEEVGLTPLLRLLTRASAVEEAPDWPLVLTLPEDVIEQQIDSVLSGWLKAWRKGEQGVGRVLELARPGAPRLQEDSRKRVGVEVECVEELQSLPDESAAFLWTPFAVQRAEDRQAQVGAIRRVIEPGGTWAFTDVVPASMPGHWLYRFFPEAWHNEKQHTWDAFHLYNALVGAGFEVKLERQNVYQAVTLGVALRMARERQHCPQLVALPDEVYAANLAALGKVVKREGARSPVGSEFCLVWVVAVRR